MTATTERRQQTRQSTTNPVIGRLTRDGADISVVLIEKSQSGFTVSIPPAQAILFPGGETAILHIGNNSVACTVSGYFREGTLKSHLGLKVTPPATPDDDCSAIPEGAQRASLATTHDNPPCRWYGPMAIAVLFLPGLGDLIGTAPIARQAIQIVYQWSIQAINLL
ncbi:MAG: hypothetical protein RLY14_2226 [Planctomycetota bacterium]